MLGLLSSPSPSFFCLDNICTAALSASTQAGTPLLVTARGKLAQMAGEEGGCQGTGTGWKGMAGRDCGSHLASVLAPCPGASSTFTQQNACQKLEVTLCKIFSLNSLTVFIKFNLKFWMDSCYRFNSSYCWEYLRTTFSSLCIDYVN